MGGRNLRTHLVVLGLTLALAWVTRRYVEIPGGNWQLPYAFLPELEENLVMDARIGLLFVASLALGVIIISASRSFAGAAPSTWGWSRRPRSWPCSRC